jgi:hypothetical protein
MARVTSLDLVGRVFARSGPNQSWMTDITEHPTREGKLYCLRRAGRVLAHGRRLGGRQHADHPARLGHARHGHPKAHSRRRTRDPFRQRRPVHILGLQSQRPRRRPGPFDGCCRPPLRQCHGRIVLGTHASELFNRQNWKIRIEPARSTTTSSSSTTPAADTARCRCSPRPNTNAYTPTTTPPDSRTPTPRKRRQITASKITGAVQAALQAAPVRPDERGSPDAIARNRTPADHRCQPHDQLADRRRIPRRTGCVPEPEQVPLDRVRARLQPIVPGRRAPALASRSPKQRDDDQRSRLSRQRLTRRAKPTTTRSPSRGCGSTLQGHGQRPQASRQHEAPHTNRRSRHSCEARSQHGATAFTPATGRPRRRGGW